MYVCVHAKVLQSCPTPFKPMDCSPQGYSGPWGSPDKNTGVGCHFLLQGIFLTQGLKFGLCVSCISRWVLYH